MIKQKRKNLEIQNFNLLRWTLWRSWRWKWRWSFTFFFFFCVFIIMNINLSSWFHFPLKQTDSISVWFHLIPIVEKLHGFRYFYSFLQFPSIKHKSFWRDSLTKKVEMEMWARGDWPENRDESSGKRRRASVWSAQTTWSTCFAVFMAEITSPTLPRTLASTSLFLFVASSINNANCLRCVLAEAIFCYF